MKKTLILTAIILLAASTTVYADEANQTNTQKQYNRQERPQFQGNRPPQGKFDGQRPHKGPDFEKRNSEFEKRLNLSDEQKKQVEQMRQKDFEKMKPVMDKLKTKQKEAETLRTNGNNTEKLEQLKKEIGALKKETHEMRMQNMKEFENILNKDQLKELNTMKEEGRKKFEERKQNCHPNMMQRPLKEQNNQ